LHTFVCTFLEFWYVDRHLLDFLLCFLVICCRTAISNNKWSKNYDERPGHIAGGVHKNCPFPWGSAPPPNRCTWLHGPTRVHNRNAISTGSDQVVVVAPRHKETVAGSTEDNAVTYMQIRGLTRPVVTGECLVGEPKHADSHPVNCVGEKSPPPRLSTPDTM